MDSLAVIVDDLETGAVWRYAFLKSPIRIGRSELSDVPLPLPYVSSCHAVLQFDDQEVHYVDLGSLNGSALDGARLQANVPATLGEDSEIHIGNLRLRCARTDQTETKIERPVTHFSQRVSQLALAAQPPPVQEPAAPSAAQMEAVEGVLFSAGIELDLQYASYRAAWEHLQATIEQSLLGMEGPSRALLLSRLLAKYPALEQEPQFRALAGEAESPKPAAQGGGAATGFLRAFAQSYLPASEKIATPDGAERLFTRVAEVLESFGKSYVELRKGHEEFGKEMGVPVPNDSPLERSRDAQQVLAYLLDLRADGRSAELQGSFGNLMLHQVALLNGVSEGARALLARLDPEAVSAASAQSVWPLKASSQWKVYEDRWHEIADDPDGVSDAIFGSEFARAYTAIVGKRADEKNGTPPPQKSPQPRR